MESSRAQTQMARTAEQVLYLLSHRASSCYTVCQELRPSQLVLGWGFICKLASELSPVTVEY